MTYAKAVLVAIDQLGNAIAGGNPDCTISGRIGYYQEHAVRPYVWYWNMLAFVVNLTFYPWDGPDHCKQAYVKEVKNEFNVIKHAIPLVLFLLSLITITSCLAIAPISWIIYGVKKLLNYGKN